MRFSKGSSLIVVDYQNYFLKKIEKESPFRKNVEKLIKIFLNKNLPIYGSRHYNIKSKDDPFFRFYGKIIEKKSDDFNIESDIAKYDKITFYEKSDYSAISNKKILKELKSQKVDDIFLCGLYLEKCILATAIDCFRNNFNVFVVKEAIYSKKKELEKYTFEIINTSFGKVVSIDDFKEYL